MATLKDVAVRAGVSTRTVSNVVNDWPHVSDRMRTLVLDAIDELGYHPNLAARNLRNGRSGLIAVALPEFDVPYFAELTRCLVEEFERRDLTVVVEQTDGKLQRERAFLNRNARASMFDGIVFNPVEIDSTEVESLSAGRPMVLLGEQHSAGVARVSMDNVSAAREATEHLIGLGRTRIGLIGDHPTAGRATAQQRRAGYEAALNAAHLPIRSELIPPTRMFRRADGLFAMDRLLALRTPPDAVLCLNDLVAIGAMRSIQRSGRTVPDDVAIVGFDGVEEGRYHTPSLTSMAPDKRMLAERTVDALVRQLEQDHHGYDLDQTVPFSLAIGGSSDRNRS